MKKQKTYSLRRGNKQKVQAISGLVVLAVVAGLGMYMVSLQHSVSFGTSRVNLSSKPAAKVIKPADVQLTAVSTAPINLAPATLGTFSATFTSATERSDLIIDAEIYDAAGQKVYQFTQPGQTLNGTAKKYDWTWTPTAAGNYQIRLGIFTADWQTTLLWNASAGSFSVTATAPVSAAASTTVRTSNTTSSSNAPWGDMPFYVDPANAATAYARANPNTPNVSHIAREGQTPVAKWLGGWNVDIKSAAQSYTTAAANAAATPVLVAYNIPRRDCGGYSAGGAGATTDYLNWVQGMANGIGGRLAVVILEPDALASVDCLSAGDQQTRYSTLSQAVNILKANSRTYVYLDAGNAGWQSAATLASRLSAANIAKADGFSLNVSNFVSTATSTTFGAQLSALVGNKHFVVDTGRNGTGAASDGAWCNPSGRTLGAVPTTHTGNTFTDAFLWVKEPWGSDGPCNGGPAAGENFWTYAVQLAKNAGW